MSTTTTHEAPYHVTVFRSPKQYRSFEAALDLSYRFFNGQTSGSDRIMDALMRGDQLCRKHRPEQLYQAKTYEGMRRIEAATLIHTDYVRKSESVLLGGGSRSWARKGG